MGPKAILFGLGLFFFTADLVLLAQRENEASKFFRGLGLILSMVGGGALMYYSIFSQIKTILKKK